MLRQITPVFRNVVSFSRVGGNKTACTVLIYWITFFVTLSYPSQRIRTWTWTWCAIESNSSTESGRKLKLRYMHLNLPTLKYRRLRGDMIEVFKITHDIYDSEVSPNLRCAWRPQTTTNDRKQV